MCDENPNIISGIIIGIVGGLFAGLGVWLLQVAKEEWFKKRDKKRVYTWLSENVEEGIPNRTWRSARTIASHTDLPVDRVIYICSIHKDIAPNTGENENMFTLKSIAPR